MFKSIQSLFASILDSNEIGSIIHVSSVACLKSIKCLLEVNF